MEVLAAQANSQAMLCQEVEAELKELCAECKKRFPIIKDYTERAIVKLKGHKELVEQHAAVGGELPAFPLDEVLRAILMACETFQNKIVLLSLSCLQRLIHRRVLKDETIAIVINLMKEQATNGDESVQLKVLQTIMATPAHMTLLNELVVEQLMQLLYVLHNAASASVHHTACAGLRQLAEYFSDKAASAAATEPSPGSRELQKVLPVIQRAPGMIPTVAPSQAPSGLSGPLRMFYVFVQDLCVMADYDAYSLSSRYAQDAGERMRTGSREGFWLAAVKFPRPLCLELLGTCVAAHPEVFASCPECFALLRHNICAVLLKNLRGCFDFAILIRSVQVLQEILRCSEVASLLMQEMQVFLHLMLDLTTAERSPWQRATSLEFLKSVCEDPATLGVLYEHGVVSPTDSSAADSGPRTFLELVNSLSKLMHQVCFSTGMDSGALLQSAAGTAATPSGKEDRQRTAPGPLLGGALRGANILGNLGAASLPSFGIGAGSFGSGSGSGRDMGASGAEGLASSGGERRSVTTTSSMGGRGATGARMKLLQLMNEAEPPIIQPAFLVSLVVECVFAIVSTLYQLLLEAGEEVAPLATPVASTSGSATPSAAAAEASLVPVGTPHGPGRACAPLVDPLSEAQGRCREMLADCWASLLSALSLLLHGMVDEAFLQQALRALQTLLFCCARLGLEQARDACLLQLSRYALPGQGPEGDGPDAAAMGATANRDGALTAKHAICFKALLNFCYCYGGLLGVVGWTIALRALNGLEKVPRRGNELAVLRQALDSLFETTALLPEEALADIVGAMGEHLRGVTDNDEGIVGLNRLVELCMFNQGRLLSVWDRVLDVASDVCATEQRAELRGVAAAAVCRILAQALRKGALAMTESPEAAQEQLLQPLEGFLRLPHEDTRARVCEGLLAILQASGQELHPAAWSVMINLVATAAQLELERAGLDFFLPRSLDSFSPENGDVGHASAVEVAEAVPAAGDGRDAASSLPTVFQLLELLVQDFMEYVPLGSVPHLTTSIGAFARLIRLGVNSSLTAVGFLWNIADALARYHCAPPFVAETANGNQIVGADGITRPSEPGASFEELWVQIFVHLRVLAADGRPEVRNCAVKSISSALLSHGRKVGIPIYQRCLQDVLIRVLAEIEDATRRARDRDRGGGGAADGLIVHHSRDTLEKQWDETMVLAVEGVRRVLSHFAEEAGVLAYAPLAYRLLLQVQTTLQTLSSEVSGSALRALVDLMRIPASSQSFPVDAVASAADPSLPLHSSGETSVWLLGWGVLWRTAQICSNAEVPEPLMEAFTSSLNSLRGSHHQHFTPAQHMVVTQLALVLVTSPSFYVPSSTPILAVDGPEGDTEDSQCFGDSLSAAVGACVEDAEAKREERGGAASAILEQEVFDFAKRSPHAVWQRGHQVGGRGMPSYTKASSSTSCYVEANQSRNVETRAVEAALREAARQPAQLEEVVQAFLGPGRSPTHRTMLHVCSARLQHVQGFVFGLLEDTQGLQQPFLETLFLYQCCAVFLDARVALLDTNKLALAARTLCLIVLFCRRVLLCNLARLGSTEPEAFAASCSPAAHIEALVGAVPQLLRVLLALACCRERPRLRASGLWKLALEVLLYLIEDTLPALERPGAVSPSAAASYWEAVVGALGEVVAVALPGTGAEVRAKPAVSDVLLQAVGNLIVHRLLMSAATPKQVSAQAVQLLGDLVALQGIPASPQGAGSSSVASVEPPAALGHLFDLCASPDAHVADNGVGEEVCEQSVAAMTARGGGAPRAPAARLPDRQGLLVAAVPALLGRMRTLLAAHVAGSDPASCAEATRPVACDEAVRDALLRLKAFRADGPALAALEPALAGEKARATCHLAGSMAFSAALLPQLGALSASSDERVRQLTAEVLAVLAAEFGL